MEKERKKKDGRRNVMLLIVANTFAYNIKGSGKSLFDPEAGTLWI